MQVYLQPLVRGWDAPFMVPANQDRMPFVDGSHPSAMRPFMNTRNKVYGLPNYRPIGGREPLIKAEQYNTLIARPNTLFSFGAASSYRLSDESLRQLSVSALIAAQQQSFFKTATR